LLSYSTTNKFPKLSKAILRGEDNLSDVEPDDIEHATIQRKPFSSEPIIRLLFVSVMKRYLFPSKITYLGLLSEIVRFGDVFPATVIPFICPNRNN